MAESNTYVGVVSTSDVLTHDTYQQLTSEVARSKDVQWAAFKKSPFMSAIGLEAFGVEAMTDLDRFITAKPSGRIIRYDKGKFGISGQIFASAPTAFHVGRMGTFNPELVEGGDEWAYAWHRLVEAEFIPDVDVQDNSAGTIDIKLQKESGMKQKYVESINYCLLGNSSAPDTGTMGPDSVYSDLPNLISVTQTRTVGGISKSGNTYWNNGYKAVTSVGGGGELDRPLLLRRSMNNALNDQLQYAEAGKDYLVITTQGAHEYYDRLMYADSLKSGNSAAFGSLAKYDAAGIQHFAFDGCPMVWDPAVTVPYGATASTEAFYFVHIPSYFISLRKEENFLFTGWEQPREHDNQRTLVAQIRTRYTPGVTAMRPHTVVYNLPASPD